VYHGRVSSFVAHAFAGLTVLELARGTREPSFLEAGAWSAAVAGASVLPDIDTLLLGPAGHRMVTHTLGFAAVVGAVAAAAAVLAHRRVPALWAFPLLLGVTSLHAMMDIWSGVGAAVPVLAPLSPAKYLARHGWVPGALLLYDVSGIPYALRGLILETGIFVPLWLLARWRRRSLRGAAIPRRNYAIMGALSAAVWLAHVLTVRPE
jgi:membrane-bound metal-dependent hydrolase YbcI (DUF457 family)